MRKWWSYEVPNTCSSRQGSLNALLSKLCACKVIVHRKFIQFIYLALILMREASIFYPQRPGTILPHGRTKWPTDPCAATTDVLRVLFMGVDGHLLRQIRWYPMPQPHKYGKPCHRYQPSRGRIEDLLCSTVGCSNCLYPVDSGHRGARGVDRVITLSVTLRPPDVDECIALIWPLLHLKKRGDMWNHQVN